MAEAAAKSIRIARVCPPGKPLGVTSPAASGAGAIVSNKPALLKEATIRGTITTSGDTFTVLGLNSITCWELTYEGALPAVIISATSATNVLTITVTDGTVVHGRVWGL